MDDVADWSVGIGLAGLGTGVTAATARDHDDTAHSVAVGGFAAAGAALVAYAMAKWSDDVLENESGTLAGESLELLRRDEIAHQLSDLEALTHDLRGVPSNADALDRALTKAGDVLMLAEYARDSVSTLGDSAEARRTQLGALAERVKSDEASARAAVHAATVAAAAAAPVPAGAPPPPAVTQTADTAKAALDALADAASAIVVAVRPVLLLWSACK